MDIKGEEQLQEESLIEGISSFTKQPPSLSVQRDRRPAERGLDREEVEQCIIRGCWGQGVRQVTGESSLLFGQGRVE